MYELDGQILLLGIDHTANTTIHLAESLAGVRYRRPKYITVLRDGSPVRLHYAEIDHCSENFTLVDGWLAEHQLQRKGQVGNATARLARSQEIVDVVTARLKKSETAFLHPRGTDEQCDEAQASIPA